MNTCYKQLSTISNTSCILVNQVIVLNVWVKYPFSDCQHTLWLKDSTVYHLIFRCLFPECIIIQHYIVIATNSIIHEAYIYIRFMLYLMHEAIFIPYLMTILCSTNVYSMIKQILAAGETGIWKEHDAILISSIFIFHNFCRQCVCYPNCVMN